MSMLSPRFGLPPLDTSIAESLLLLLHRVPSLFSEAALSLQSSPVTVITCHCASHDTPGAQDVMESALRCWKTVKTEANRRRRAPPSQSFRAILGASILVHGDLRRFSPPPSPPQIHRSALGWLLPAGTLTITLMLITLPLMQAFSQ
jgi:hypothetical protein